MVAKIASFVLASVLYAATATAASDNGACAQMKSICMGAIDDDVTNPWSVEACLYGASCFAGQHPVDGFLAAVYEAKNSDYTCFEGYPESRSEPRVSSKVRMYRAFGSEYLSTDPSCQVFDAISTDKKVVTQQNFVDGFYKTLDSTKGPYPSSASVVAAYYDRLTSW